MPIAKSTHCAEEHCDRSLPLLSAFKIGKLLFGHALWWGSSGWIAALGILLGILLLQTSTSGKSA
jgi:hypothetical protein